MARMGSDSALRPRLPDQRQLGMNTMHSTADGGKAASAPVTAANGAEDLQQRLHALKHNPAFQSLQSSPQQLLSVLHGDPVLQQAMQQVPALKQLLQPHTLEAAIRALGSNGRDANTILDQMFGGSAGMNGSTHANGRSNGDGMSLTQHRKALMQLQNYAQQLRLQKAQGSLSMPSNGLTLSGSQDQGWPGIPAGPGSTTGANVGTAANSVSSKQAQMLQQLQQRMARVQQRQAAIAAAGAVPVPLGVLPGLPLSGASQQWQHQHQQQQLHQLHQQQQPAGLPMLPDSQSSASSFRTPRPIRPSPFASATAATNVAATWTAPNAATAFSYSLGLPVRGSSKAAPQRASDGANAAGLTLAIPATSPQPPSALNPASASSHGASCGGAVASNAHRILRAGSAPLTSPATALSPGVREVTSVTPVTEQDVEELQPPTRIATHLSYSTSPSAQYVLDAASSDSFCPSMPSDASQGTAQEVSPGSSVCEQAQPALPMLAKLQQQERQRQQQRQQHQSQQERQQQQQQLPVSTLSVAGTSGQALATPCSAGADSAQHAGAAYNYGPAPQDPYYSYLQQSSSATDTLGSRGHGGGAPSPDPRTYYEQVPPSTWRPGDTGDTDTGECADLYRRAYCGCADALFPPLWVTMMVALTCSRALPFWGLLAVAAGTFVAGVWGFAVKLAGIPAPQMGTSRVMATLIASLEVLYLVTFVDGMLVTAREGSAGLAAALLVALPLLLLLHLRAYLLDPGFVPLPATGDEECGAGPESKGEGSSADPAMGEATAHVKVNVSNNASELPGISEVEEAPLLQQQRQPAGGARGINSCWTCGVDRPLRSKHCPLCRRCVDRHDHHCPIVGNCIGAGNQRTFFVYLAIMLTSQLLFMQLASTLLVRAYSRSHGLHGDGAGGPSGLHLLLLALWESRLSHPGWLIMVLVQVPFTFASVALLGRMAFLAASNLTVNEWLNRSRYQYLTHELAGYCNRFDRGIGTNCLKFWVAPGGRDWWAEWERADQELLASRSTILAQPSLTLLIRAWDKHSAKFRKVLADSRRARQEMVLHRRLKAAGLGDVHKNSDLQLTGGGCDSGCQHHQHGSRDWLQMSLRAGVSL